MIDQLKATLIVGYIIYQMEPYFKDGNITDLEAGVVTEALINKVAEYLGYDIEEVIKAGDQFFKK